ncbi:MAG: malate dehydrogenase [bacterium JZ-2024 1]
MRFKVGIVGAGNVGAETAREIQARQIADVVLVDIIEGMPQGKGLDMSQSSPIYSSSARVYGSNDISSVEGSDVVVITAGVARKPGMSREDLLATNFRIVKGVCEQVKKYAPQAIVIMVTNPLDAMVYTAYRILQSERNRILGMAGVLDSARLRYFVAEELGVSPANVQALVLGSHGDLMVPIPRFVSVSGIPAQNLIPEERMKALIERTQKGGGEIVALLKTGSAYYAPGVGITEMVESIIWDEKRLVSASVWAQGEYGLHDVFVGLPVVLGKNGVEKIVEVPLTAEEKSALERSARHVQNLQKEVDALFAG